MKNWTVRSKLLFAFINVAIIAIASGVTGTIGLQILNANQELMSQVAYSANDTMKLLANLQNQRSSFRGSALRYYMRMDFESDVAELNSLVDEFESILAAQEKMIPLEEKEAWELLTQIRKNYESDYLPLKASLTDALRRGDEDALLSILTQATKPLDLITEQLGIFSQEAINKINSTKVADQQTASGLITLIILLLVAALILAPVFAMISSTRISNRANFMRGILNKISEKGSVKLTDQERSIARAFFDKENDEISQSITAMISMSERLESIASAMESVSNGDLTGDPKVLSGEDTLGISLKKMVDNLNDIFSDINSSAAQVASGSRQVADGAQILAQSSSEQTGSIEQLGSYMSDVTSKTQKNADMAERAAALASSIKENAETGSKQMDAMIDAVREINVSGQSIGKVIKVIDDIAFQTNILALNAAVEAARAGVHGKGFAVVAEEVRNLAAKSAEAAKDTGSLIADSISKAELGATIANKTAEGFVEIVSGINTSNELIEEIAKSSGEQSGGIEHINTSIERMARLVQQNNSTAEESSAASQEMSGQADMLKQLVSQFKLKDNYRLQNHPSLPPIRLN